MAFTAGATTAPEVILTPEVSRNADSRLSPVGELQASGLEHLPKTIYGALAELLAALKADNGFRGYLRGGG
jgi:hypothetical protein